MNRMYKTLLVAGLVAFSATAQGCGIINNLRAKDALNNGVREFNRGKYDEAEKRFARALELDPDNTNAMMFHARSLNQKFDNNQTEETGLATIQAYEQIIQKNKDNEKAVDQALAFQADVNQKLAVINPNKANEYKERRRELVLKRAELPGASTKTKADVYYTLGHSYWDEAFQTSRPYTDAGGVLKQPLSPEASEKLKQLTQKAHEYFQKAVATQPDYADAYFYEKLTFIQDTYWTNDPKRKQELAAKIKEYQDKYLEINKRAQQAAGSQ